MNQATPNTAPNDRRPSRGIAAIAMIVVLVVVNLVVVGLTLGLARDHELTIRRIQSIRAMYAAEAGMNMSIREMINDVDEDGDGTTGTISDDGNAANDPDLGNAQVVVTSAVDVPAVGQVTLTSEGRSGDARRTTRTILE